MKERKIKKYGQELWDKLTTYEHYLKWDCKEVVRDEVGKKDVIGVGLRLHEMLHLCHYAGFVQARIEGCDIFNDFSINSSRDEIVEIRTCVQKLNAYIEESAEEERKPVKQIYEAGKKLLECIDKALYGNE